MAAPRVFVSSTFYDLRYIRENLRYFIRTLGYEPVLSEDGDVFYNPAVHTHDSCIFEVPTCQMFVLIVGGRYGGDYISGDTSITNMEYKKALDEGIPVFALVEQSVYADHSLYNHNLKNKQVDSNKIAYKNADDVRIFHFIDEVRRQAANNAIVPFRDFADIESYLRKQWAAMMFNYLTEKSNADKVATTLEEISKVNEKIENLSRQILTSVSSGEKLTEIELQLELQDLMDSSQPIGFAEQLLSSAMTPKQIRQERLLTPAEVLRKPTYTEFLTDLGYVVKFYEAPPYHYYSVSAGKRDATASYIGLFDEEYIDLQKKIKNILTKYDISVDKYLEQSNHRA